MAEDTGKAAAHNPESPASVTLRGDHQTPQGEYATAAPTGWGRKRLIFLLVFVILLVLGAPYGWRLWQYYQTHESTDDAYVVGDIVPISARVNGTVLSVHVDDHQQVEVDQLLVRLDPRDFAMRVQQAEAAVAVALARVRQVEIEVEREQGSTSSDTARTHAGLQAAQSALQEAQHNADEVQARLRALEAAVAATQADIDVKDARYDMTRMSFERSQQLLADGVVAQQQFDESESALRAAQAERLASRQKLTQAQREVERAQVELRMQRQAVERVRARVAEAHALMAGSEANRQNVAIKQAQVEVARAMLQQQQADLAYAKLQLDYTTLRAPMAGVIAKRNIEVGQVVQAGRPLLAVVPLHHVWVEANFKETQLQHMRPGQKAMLKVDAYPGEVFQGTVESISPGTGAVFSLLPPENATGNFVKVVQRIPVKIVLAGTSPRGSQLRPGMSVIATVTTRE
jgi:membrane fusion protein, multidrug efflux system